LDIADTFDVIGWLIIIALGHHSSVRDLPGVAQAKMVIGRP